VHTLTLSSVHTLTLSSVHTLTLSSVHTLTLSSVHTLTLSSVHTQRFEETHLAAKAINADVLRLESEFVNQEKILEERASEWRKSVEAIQAKLQDSFSNYMERLQYMGEIQLRSKETFMDWGESELHSIYAALCPYCTCSSCSTV
jgi:hypothetical protein